MSICPCASGREYSQCCEPLILGHKPAETAEQLMRARYSAHVKVEIDFLFASTHPDHREGYDHQGTRTWAEQSTWHGLEIQKINAGGMEDSKGDVEFIARFRDKNGLRTHHERAQFERKGGQWFFTRGDMLKSQPITVSKLGRNDPCLCGSGLKYKKCCGT